MQVLFIYAHLDDETILSYGTILKYASMGYNVTVCVLCGNSRFNDKNADKRFNAFKQNFNNLKNINVITYSYNDLTLTDEIITNVINSIFNKVQPNIVITHALNDLHEEHQRISRLILVKCRLTDNKIQRLLVTVSPTYQWTYSTQGNFVPNVFIDISNFISEKVKALKNYEFELKYNNNDLRSVASVINWNKHYGNVINTEYCEPYQQLFCKE